MSKSLIAFLLVCAAHLAEHIIQAYQVYVLHLPLAASRGILGHFYPKLVHSESLHFTYALLMFVGLWWFRSQWQGKAKVAWTVAAIIQSWHFIEHSLLFGQALIGHNLFSAPQPISIIQLIGWFNGTAETGFGGLLKLCTCPCSNKAWTWHLLFVRRVEVHLIYNMAVAIPMAVAMFWRHK